MPIFGAEIPCGSRAGFDIVGIRCGSSANKEEDRSMRKIIIDTDPGIDDAAAIAIAMFSPELDVQLITTVSGNVSVEKTTHNALRLMTLWNAGVPVAAGASRSLTGMQYDVGDTHGESGMDGFAFDEVTVQPVKLHAVEAMRRVLERSEEKITLVPIGPLTNLALLFVQYPEVKEKIEEIVLMGGAFLRGNITPAAEFNIYVDPEAARMVFKAGIPMIMCGLDVTMKAYATGEDIDAFAALGTRAGKFCADIFRFYYDFHMSGVRGKLPGCAVHDAVTVMALTHPELMRGEDAYVEVDIDGEHTWGCTASDFRERNCSGEKNARVILDIDREAFIQQLLKAAASFS